MAQLNDSLEKLQPLAEQLDPLESSYADVRFLDVDYEQTEKQYDSILDDLRKEIDEENMLIDLAKQLEAELKNLQPSIESESTEQLAHTSSHVIPELYSRLHNLKGKIADAGKRRRIVYPSAELNKCETILNSTDAAIKDNLSSLIQKEQQAAVEEIQKQIHQLQQSPEIKEIQMVEEKLSKLTFANDTVSQLQKSLTAIKQNQVEKEKAQQQLVKEVDLLAEKINHIQEKHPIAAKDSGKSKKRKKGQQKPVETNRKTQIHELRKSVDELEGEVLPSLAKLKDEVLHSNVQNVLPEQQHTQAIALIQLLKVNN